MGMGGSGRDCDAFPLVVETPRGDLVAGMKRFLGTSTSRFNRRHRLSGHLFGGRYKALIVDGSIAAGGSGRKRRRRWPSASWRRR